MNFVILKQIQKIHTQWLRQAQPPCYLLHGAWACRRPFLFLPMISTPLNHRIIYYYTRCLSLSKAVLIPPCDFDSAQSPYYLLLHSVPERSRRHILNSHLGAWACRRHIISIALKSVCFLEHLWYFFGNSKTLLFQQISVDFVLLKQTQIFHT